MNPLKSQPPDEFSILLETHRPRLHAFLQAQNHRRRVMRQQRRELPGDDLFDRIADLATERHAPGELEEKRQSALVHCLKKLREPHRDLLLSREADLNRNAMAQKLFRIKSNLARCVRKQLGEDS